MIILLPNKTYLVTEKNSGTNSISEVVLVGYDNDVTHDYMKFTKTSSDLRYNTVVTMWMPTSIFWGFFALVASYTDIITDPTAPAI